MEIFKKKAKSKPKPLRENGTVAMRINSKVDNEMREKFVWSSLPTIYCEPKEDKEANKQGYDTSRGWNTTGVLLN
jgi:hypothetical protein